MCKSVLVTFLSVLTLHAMDTSHSAIDIQNMSLDEKIGQMLIVAAVSKTAPNEEFLKTQDYYVDPVYVKDMIEKYNVGGVLFIGKSNPQGQVEYTNQLQKISKYPLLIFQDTAECTGLGMRMDESHVTQYPKAMTLGALNETNDYLLFNLGRHIASENKTIGVHCGLGPVCDVNNNPQNPVINTRSFGEDPKRIALKAHQFMQGLQCDHKFIGCAKHFPGHGDTTQDSHVNLPTIKTTEKKFVETELVPFNELIKYNVKAIMTAHIDMPLVTKENGLPTSLSARTINCLRNSMGYKGLVITDGLGMKGVTNHYTHQDIAVRAIAAGNDMLLCPIDVSRAFCAIKSAVENNIIPQKEIDEHVQRIIATKKSAHIQRSIQYDPTKLRNNNTQQLKRRLYRAAITLARNNRNRLPIKSKSPLVISIGKSINDIIPFRQQLQKHAENARLWTLADDYELLDVDSTKTFLQESCSSDHIIASVHVTSAHGMLNPETDATLFSFINNLGSKVTLVLFGNPYNLNHFTKNDATIVAYENDPYAQEAAADVLFGTYIPQGQLPVTVNKNYIAGTSLTYEQEK